MSESRLPAKIQNIVSAFTQGLKEVYPDELVSVILYGSAASGEFVDKHSNLNLLVVLKTGELSVLKRSNKLVRKTALINSLFLTEDYISASTDTFPIEFLDMRENYAVIFGKDVLKDIHIDLGNLRFQCEQELKAKLIKLRQGYLYSNNNPDELRGMLLLMINPVLHISRNILRLKGKACPYKKSDIIRQLADDFAIDADCWNRILSAKNKQIKISNIQIDGLFGRFIKDLGNLTGIADEL